MKRSLLFLVMICSLTATNCMSMISASTGKMVQRSARMSKRTLYTRTERNVKVNLLFGLPERYSLSAPVYRLPRKAAPDAHHIITNLDELLHFITCQKNNKRTTLLKTFGSCSSALVKNLVDQDYLKKSAHLSAGACAKRSIEHQDLVKGAIHLLAERGICPSRISYALTRLESDEGGFDFGEEILIAAQERREIEKLAELKNGIGVAMVDIPGK